MPFFFVSCGGNGAKDVVGDGYREEVFGVDMIFLREAEWKWRNKIGFLLVDFGGDATYPSGFRGWALIFFRPANAIMMGNITFMLK